MVYIIYDIVIGLILLFFALRGHKRGLILTLCSLVAVLVAFVGANFIADALTPRVADLLAPKITAIIEQHLTGTAEQDSQSESGVSVGGDSADSGTAADVQDAGAETASSGNEDPDLLDDLMDKLHLPAGMIDTIRDTVDNLQNIKDLPSALSQAIARTAAETVLYLLIFLISFIVLLIAWKFIGNALDLVARLPVLHFFNKTGGFIFGLCKGTFFLFIVAWVLKYLGGIIPDDAVEHTYLLHFFMTSNPFALIVGG